METLYLFGFGSSSWHPLICFYKPAKSGLNAPNMTRTYDHPEKPEHFKVFFIKKLPTFVIISYKKSQSRNLQGNR